MALPLPRRQRQQRTPPLAQFCIPCAHSSGPTRAKPTSQGFPNEELLPSHQEAADVPEQGKAPLAGYAPPRGQRDRSKEAPPPAKQFGQSWFQVSKEQSWQKLVEPHLPYLVSSIWREPLDKREVCSSLTSADWHGGWPGARGRQPPQGARPALTSGPAAWGSGAGEARGRCGGR